MFENEKERNIYAIYNRYLTVCTYFKGSIEPNDKSPQTPTLKSEIMRMDLM